MKKKTKMDNWMKIGIAITVGFFLLMFVVVLPAKAGGSFWAGIQQLVANRVSDKVIAETPSFDLPEMFAGVSPDKYFQQNFMEGYTTGGSSLDASTTLTIARSVTAAEFCDNSYIHVNSAALAITHLAAASLDLTFPATSTLFATCLTYPGAEKTIVFRNNSPTAATTTELVAGTGCDARISGDTGASDTIAGLNEAVVTIRRQDDAFADGGSIDCIMLIETTIPD